MSADKKVRVLTVTTVDVTLGKLLRPLLSALRSEGYIAECASADGPYAEDLRRAGFVVHRLPFKRRVVTPLHFVALFRLYRLIRRYGYDIVHVHTPFAQVVGRIAARMAGVPIVLYTSHGFQFHESRPRWAQVSIMAIERMLGRWTDLIFTQSREDAGNAARIGIAPESRIMWIGNGIELDRFSPGPDDGVREEFGIPKVDIVIGFTGRIVREKGVVELVEALKEVVALRSEVRLLIVGDTLESDGDSEAKNIIGEMIAKYGLAERVHFAGFREDVPRLLRAMDVFVLPSWREGMPRSIIEAMAVGLPVIATDIRGCREEVIDSETGFLVPPRQPARLAEAILGLISDLPRARGMGLKGRQRALQWFDERKVVARQLGAYDNLLTERGLRSHNGR